MVLGRITPAHRGGDATVATLAIMAAWKFPVQERAAMIEPKLGKFVWRVRDEHNKEGDKEYFFVGITRHRIVAWDKDTICSDSGGQGEAWSCLFWNPWSSYFATEQEATNEAHRVAKAHQAKGETIKLDGALGDATA
jgi:hypothetical protein